MKRLTKEQEEAIQDRLARAADGPWRMESNHKHRAEVWEDSPTGVEMLAVYCDAWGRAHAPDTAEFIAHARMDIPVLLDEIEALRAEVRRQGILIREQNRQIATLKDYIP